MWNIDKPQNNTGSKRLGLISLIVLGLNVGGIVLLPLVVMVIKVMFFKVFSEYGVELPPLTRFFVSIPTIIYVLFCLGIAGVLVIKELLISNKKVRLIVNIIAAVGASGFVFVYAVAFILPLISLITRLPASQ